MGSVFLGHPVFVDVSHQTGLDTRLMTKGQLKVGIRGGESQAQAEAWSMLVIGSLSAMWA